MPKMPDYELLRYTLRIDRLLFQKFRYVAESEGRSANKEIEQLIIQRIKAWEKTHNFILSDDDFSPRSKL